MFFFLSPCSFALCQLELILLASAPPFFGARLLFLCLGESFLKRRHNPLLIEASPPLGSVCKVFLPHLFCTNVPLFSGDDCDPGNSL
mmetsp:Transcript_6352/g.16428  ORF Transcript_6352/g.16428 Transcript_6352/m.16428 type:complete len:87 (+) Transcript_6352:161-421(+)